VPLEGACSRGRSPPRACCPVPAGSRCRPRCRARGPGRPAPGPDVPRGRRPVPSGPRPRTGTGRQDMRGRTQPPRQHPPDLAFFSMKSHLSQPANKVCSPFDAVPQVREWRSLGYPPAVRPRLAPPPRARRCTCPLRPGENFLYVFKAGLTVRWPDPGQVHCRQNARHQTEKRTVPGEPVVNMYGPTATRPGRRALPLRPRRTDPDA
jgi:hypothetical protein